MDFKELAHNRGCWQVQNLQGRISGTLETQESFTLSLKSHRLVELNS